LWLIDAGSEVVEVGTEKLGYYDGQGSYQYLLVDAVVCTSLCTSLTGERTGYSNVLFVGYDDSEGIFPGGEGASTVRCLRSA
jgi:hypothetical protein